MRIHVFGLTAFSCSAMFVRWDRCVFVCVRHVFRYGWSEGHTEVTEFCVGRRCSACAWPQSRVCSSTCMSRRCSRSERSCMDWHEFSVLHTHRCLKGKQFSMSVSWRKRSNNSVQNTTLLNTHISLSMYLHWQMYIPKKWMKKKYFEAFFLQTCAAGAGVVQPKACVTFTHGAEVGAHTAAICTAAFVRILLWTVTFYIQTGRGKVGREKMFSWGGKHKSVRNMIGYEQRWCYLGYSLRKLPGNPAPHQTRSPDASHTDDWTSLNTRRNVFSGKKKGKAEAQGQFHSTGHKTLT